ncbi:unnamed protein product [Rotaria sordida]|uniref:EGF-like domain-containing protein n=1 Tax=Rotaria sordida TaxID=392033 RepID=A0A814LVK6_9BILA|nr:unnamed protein product [Rotaria sordida]CAF3557813.1 unnamed protein product [Rotaria sordida]CAF3613996.1 unnamed protein product [Rotaria sordida]
MFNGMIVIVIALFIQLHNVYAQNACTGVALAACGQHPCIQTGTEYSCLCSNMQLAQSAAQCNIINPIVTQPPIVFPNQCGNAVCPPGATCIPTNQNPPLYVCVCANNVIANPTCPTTLPNNPCLLNPCINGGTCVVNQLTLQAVCVCPQNTYGRNCATYYPSVGHHNNWCYNGGRHINAYGQPYCTCPYHYRGRRCELQYSPYNYVYLYQYPQQYGK